MSRCLKLLTSVAAFVVILTGVGRSAALVGETYHSVVAAEPEPARDQFKPDYRRPTIIPFPTTNRYTNAKARLGRVLYFDPRISGHGALSCASCHNPGFSYGDGRAKSLGDKMNPLDRRSPSIINNAWGESFMWDGRAPSLEEQVAGPIENPDEMNQSLDTLVRELTTIAAYRSLFATAFPKQDITGKTIVAAIATFERTIVSGLAPFDAWVEGDEAAISESAKHGFTLFNTKAKCASCHGGWLFTDDGFHDIGLPDVDLGRGRLLPRVISMQHAFKTPSLRETVGRAPYMHNGSMPTLEAVVAQYNDGGIERPSKSELIKPLGLSPAEQADIVEFLQTLTSDVDAGSTPTLPR